MVCEAGKAAIWKSGSGESARTISVALAVRLIPPPLPVTLNGCVPLSVSEAAVMVKRLDPGGVTGLSLHSGVVPWGRPVTDNAMEAVNPEVADSASVYVTSSP